MTNDPSTVLGYVEAVTPTDARSPLATGPAPRARLPEFDVVRSIVLIGVFTMNYIVFWRTERLAGGWQGDGAPGWLTTFMNPWTGPLSTRFAATLVTLVGVGVSLGGRTAEHSGDPATINEHRWRLRRRGVLFILIGVMFDAAWSGGVLHYVGTYLLLVSFVFAWRTRHLVVLTIGVVLLTVAERVAVFVVVGDDQLSWWSGINGGTFRRHPVGTPQGYLSSVLSWGGHPVLPWLGFVLGGIVLARVLVPHNGAPVTNRIRAKVIGVGLGIMGCGFAFAMVANSVVTDRWRWIASLDPVASFGPPFGLAMPAYFLSTLGSSVIAITVISWVARRTARWLPVRVLTRAGRVTFSLYVLHGLIPWALTVHGIVGTNLSLYQALGVAFGSWSLAVVVGALYLRWRGIGPMEWLLRKIGG